MKVKEFVLPCLVTSLHKLETETVKYMNKEQYHTICKCCNTKVIESDYHLFSMFSKICIVQTLDY